MKRLFYIEKEKFLCEMLRLSLEQVGIDCYSISGLEDNLYLINDLSPDWILFDVKTCRPHLDDLFKLIRGGTVAIPLYATGTSCDLQRLDQKFQALVSEFIQKPISPTQITSLFFKL